ncbi:Wzz/FepE/Etk N-terminal domain-containing protein [Syntrophus sp. (in: bacteria)]|uniref:Wzz/FepE/Etk N-terminal domain-containing protein n=1 Tax=Syntrophus sp. (in: bacteria) TaxID=48412 RepID=UPI00345E9096
MMTEPAPNLRCSTSAGEEEVIHLLDLWRVIWKRRKFIALLAVSVVVATIGASLFMDNIYQARAVIIPITAKDSGGGGALSALASQFGGVAGVSLPGSSSSSEIISLLNSNILREKVVDRHRLMPVLFYERWDSRKGQWKRDEGISLNPLKWLMSLVKAAGTSDPKGAGGTEEEGVPKMWDALRLLKEIVQVNSSAKDNTIVLTVENRDPELAAKLATYFLDTLTEHMSSEAKRVALINRNYLEQQLQATADPLIRQKIYNLIAQQLETAMMAEVKENFAFKVIDPPKIPDRKVKPKRALMAVLSLAAALFMGVFIAFFLEYLKRAQKRGRGENVDAGRGEGS